ncbi:MAG: RluA family pseudouridine synthase [Saprospiraceae bacterium]|nr:RluA family pseudouridine synthase [Saprospiraceae bacterium]
MKSTIEIIFEDEALLIVNKPPDLLTIPDRFDASKPNLYHWLSDLYEEKIFIVHRIDRETSGIICFAKTEEAHKHLSQQFEGRTVDKMYLALVEGKPNPPEGTIDKPLGPHPTQAGKMTVIRTGKSAITDYKIIENFKAFSLVEVRIKTGRTHQIRVHFKFIGHPLAVDPLYGKREAFHLSEIKHRRYQLGKDQEERPLLSRTTLHASQLTLDHPLTGERVTFAAPLPKDFQAVVNQLRKWGK